MEIGDLVECIETERTGIVVDLRRGRFSMLARIRWSLGDANWVELDEVKKLD